MTDHEPTFVTRLRLAFEQIAREIGLPSAYPNTLDGQLAAARAHLRAVNACPASWGSLDVMRGQAMEDIRRLVALKVERQTTCRRKKPVGESSSG